MNSYSLMLPGKVFSGENALENLSDLVKCCNKVAVFTDKGIEAAGLLKLPLELINNAGVEAVVLNDIAAEPTYAQVQELVDRFQSEKADVIVAIGGGSVMDTAKLASLCANGEYTVKMLLEDPTIAKKHVVSIMIPTTAGTGSEATQNAIVAVPEKELKVGIVNPQMIADYVILDAAMIKNLPRKIAAATGIDALAHAIECYTGNKANPFSDIFAMEAMRLIFANIEPACDDAQAMDAKQNMLLASFYGGVAIACSGTTAVHALSYPLGGKYHIPHGVSNAILLAPVMCFNEPASRERLAQIYDNVANGAGDCILVEQKSHWVVERLGAIVRHLNIPTSLSDFGVPKEDLDSIVEAAMEVKRLLNNNMRPVTAEDAKRIYLEIM